MRVTNIILSSMFTKYPSTGDFLCDLGIAACSYSPVKILVVEGVQEGMCSSGDLQIGVAFVVAVEEFKRAQRFANFKTNELNTIEGQGGQVSGWCAIFHSPSLVGCNLSISPICIWFSCIGRWQLLSTSPYEHEVWGEGVYTHSLYRLGDRIPDWVCLQIAAYCSSVVVNVVFIDCPIAVLLGSK